MTAAPAEPGTLSTTFPSWLLRVILALACGITIAVTILWTEPHAIFVVALVACAVFVVVRPDSHGATTLLSVVAAVVLVETPGLSLWTAAAVLGVHATHILAALAAVVPWDTDVEYAAVRASLRRFIVVQVASQLLVLLALLISG